MSSGKQPGANNAALLRSVHGQKDGLLVAQHRGTGPVAVDQQLQAKLGLKGIADSRPRGSKLVLLLLLCLSLLCSVRNFFCHFFTKLFVQ